MTTPQTTASSATGRLPVPTPEQAAWQDLEVGMFIHFAPNTWCNLEGDNLSVPLDKINPAQLDTEQWVDVAESMGARYIIFVAKHIGGFCWWQTETTDYSVKNTPWRGGKGDVMRDLAASCRRRGMKLGVYLSPMDRKHGIGIGGKAKTEAEQKEYAALYRQQLTEILTRYGELVEVWFDGGLVVEVGDILKKHASRAMVFQSADATIRWGGSEDGTAPYPAWNVVSTRKSQAKWGGLSAFDGDPNGDCWLPVEVDTVSALPHAWFWNALPVRRLKTVEELMDAYYQSVGHGTVFLLNQTPDTSGRIPEADTRRAAEFGAEVRKRFGASVAECQGTGNLVELDFGTKRIIDHVIAMEDISAGERVRQYVIEGEVNGVWTPLCQGTAIGHKKIDFFAPIDVSKIRLRTLLAVDTPIIRKLAVYATGVTVVRKKDLRKCKYRKIGDWAARADGKANATVDIDLVPWCDTVAQYEIRVQPQAAEADIKVSDISFRMEGTESRQFIHPTADERVYDLSLTGLGQQMELGVVIEDTGNSLPSGDILLRQKPLMEGTIRLPQVWQVFSYVEKGETACTHGKLATIPAFLEIGTRRVTPVGVTAHEGRFDFAEIWGKVCEQREAYIYIPFTAEQDGTQLFGFGADWWFQAWVDGAALCDTLALGNGEVGVSMTDHVAAAELKKGEHLLVVRFISGRASSRIAIGGAQDIRDSKR